MVERRPTSRKKIKKILASLFPLSEWPVLTVVYSLRLHGLFVLFFSGSTFVVSQQQQQQQQRAVVMPPRNTKGDLQMGGKKSKFGIFSPAVYGAKIVLGDKELKKVIGLMELIMRLPMKSLTLLDSIYIY